MAESISAERKRKAHSGKSKKRYFLLFLLLAAVAAGAYFMQQKGAVGNTGTAATSKSESDQVASQPQREADAYGMITAIKGNQITLMMFSPSLMPGAKQSGASSDMPTATTDGNAISLGTSSTQGGPPQGMPAGGFGGQFSSTSTRAAKLDELKKTSLGTETITVPVGIPIIVQASGTMGGQSTVESGTLKDLTSDTVVSLWLKDAAASGTATAEYISVSGKVDMGKSNN